MYICISKINIMANTLNNKKEAVDYLIELISKEHIREDFRKNLMDEDEDFVLYILNNLVDNNTNNIINHGTTNN